MDGAARITSIDVLQDARAAVITFKAEATAALIEAESQLQRTLLWLRHDQTAYWQRQIRARQELLTRAKTDLYRKQVAQDREIRISVDQKKAVERAKRDLEAAEDKLRTVKRWIQVLDKELVLYRGECQALSTMLESSLPQAVARLDAMMDAVAAYLSLTGSAGAAAERELETPPQEGSPHEHLGGPHPAPGRDERPPDPLGPGQSQLG